MNVEPDTHQPTSPLSGLLAATPDIVNIGVESFADPPAMHGAHVVNLDWRPPAQGDDELGLKLAHLVANPVVEEANATVLERMLAPRAHWIDVVRAGDALPELDEERLLLHAGPPIPFEDMCGPMRAGIVGAALLEGWTEDPEAAERMARDGDITFSPNHDHMAVGPMGGIISRSMPVIVAEDPESGSRAYTNLNEGRVEPCATARSGMPS